VRRPPAFYDRLRQLFSERKSITTFWSVLVGAGGGDEADGDRRDLSRRLGDFAKGGTSEDSGPDLASYPLSQVPDEGATLVRACSRRIATQYMRSRMTEAQRAAAQAHDSGRHHRRRRHATAAIRMYAT